MRLVEQRKFTPLFMADTVMSANGDGDGDGGSTGTPPFDPLPCEVIIGGSAIDEGGTNFECYTVGEYAVGSMPTAGTSFTEVQNGENLYYLTTAETFDGYADGALAEQAATSPAIFGNIYVG